MYRRTNWEKVSDGKFRYHSFFPDFERWLSVTFGKNRFRGACQKRLLRVQRNFLEKTTLWNFSYRWLFLEFERKPCGTIFKVLLRVQWNTVKSCTLWEKLKYLSFPHIIWNFISTSHDIGNIVKVAFIISNGTFWGKSRLNETVFRFSPSFGSEQKTLGRVVTPAPTVLRGTFWKKTRNWTILFFFNLVEWLLVELRTVTCVSRRTFLATLFWKINLFFWFSDFEQKICKTFGEKLSANFSELNSMWTED